MDVDLQLYAGRSLDIVTQAETLGAVRRGHVITDYVATPRHRDARGPPTSFTGVEKEPAVQQFLLLVGVAALAARSTGRPRARLVPAAVARPRGATRRSVAGARAAVPTASTRSGRSSSSAACVRRVPPRGGTPRIAGHVAPAQRAAHRRLDRGRARDHGIGARAAASSRRTPSGTRAGAPIAAAR